jgi:hypothetical protein
VRDLDEELVKRLVDKVMALVEAESGPVAGEGRPTLLAVFTGCHDDPGPALEQVAGLKGSHFVVAAASPAAMETIGEERIARSANSLASPGELHALIEKSVAVVFPTLSQNTAARGAWGLRDSLPSEAMAWALKKGVPVVACRDWVCPGDGKDPYSLFLGGMLKKLEAFGVRFCSCSRLAETATGAGKNAAPKRPGPPENNPAGCRVLTASVVREASRSGQKRIVVGKGCRVTPLARDEAKDCGIELFPEGSPE